MGKKSTSNELKDVSYFAGGIELSEEQKHFIDVALEGKNVLVDACIGSGKTTAIQALCNSISEDKKILYLTYNKLLKLDAKSRITNKNAMVTNYHGFAYYFLKRNGVRSGVTDLIQRFLKEAPEIPKYDVLIIDEYQDIDQELSELINFIKSVNPTMQVVAVGDMDQKIFDKTSLKIDEYIKKLLEDYYEIQFTNCYRLSEELAAKLGRVWGKRIEGINPNCSVEIMNLSSVIDFLSRQKVKDILCLGSRTGKIAEVLNKLEKDYPSVFNKKTVYASIADEDSMQQNPGKNTAIFTTFDSSKGLERPICVVFDFTEDYWRLRANKPLQKYEILRNIFCVAASRGKAKIIFVEENEALLSEEELATRIDTNQELKRAMISKMFDFKYKEDVERCYSLLRLKKIDNRSIKTINIKANDELIDLSPCIGIYQEAFFFKGYSIDDDIAFALLFDNRDSKSFIESVKNKTTEEKILARTYLETKQERYMKQVQIPFVSEKEKDELHERLLAVFSGDEDVQVSCTIKFYKDDNVTIDFEANGLADVVKNDIVYELKYVSELKHEHFLQCASYMIGLNLKKGVLWNTRDNAMYEITIANKKKLTKAIRDTVKKIN